MFPTIATIKHVQKDDENNRFYAQAEATFTEDLDHAELNTDDLDDSVHVSPLMNVKAGTHTFDISGNGNPPFQAGDAVRVVCFRKGEMPE
jgi:hypothetical protein